MLNILNTTAAKYYLVWGFMNSSYADLCMWVTIFVFNNPLNIPRTGIQCPHMLIKLDLISCVSEYQHRLVLLYTVYSLVYLAKSGNWTDSEYLFKHILK